MGLSRQYSDTEASALEPLFSAASEDDPGGLRREGEWSLMALLSDTSTACRSNSGCGRLWSAGTEEVAVEEKEAREEETGGGAGLRLAGTGTS